MTRAAAVVTEAQQAAKGTTFTIAVDWREIDAQSFTISSATLSVYDRDDDSLVSTNLTDVSCTVASGDFTGEVRTYYQIPAADLDFGPGDYYVVWTLNLGDGQTRKVRQQLRITEA